MLLEPASPALFRHCGEPIKRLNPMLRTRIVRKLLTRTGKLIQWEPQGIRNRTCTLKLLRIDAVIRGKSVEHWTLPEASTACGMEEVCHNSVPLLKSR